MKYTPKQISQAAIAAHNVNRAYCKALGDNSQPKWGNAPDWQKDSAINGVMAIVEDPDTTPEESHGGWYAQKKNDGWSYGEVKDPEKKTHPCMVLYDELPATQKTKDTLFGATVRGVLASFVDEP